jgi:hypothetical protein
MMRLDPLGYYAEGAHAGFIGDMVYLEVMGAPILAINSLRACQDLLEKRAPNYSDRMTTTALDM